MPKRHTCVLCAQVFSSFIYRVVTIRNNSKTKRKGHKKCVKFMNKKSDNKRKKKNERWKENRRNKIHSTFKKELWCSWCERYSLMQKHKIFILNSYFSKKEKEK